MASAPLSLSRATVTRGDTEPLTKVSVIVRQGMATIRRGHEIVDSANVANVESVDRRSWRVTLTDGQTWHVQKARGG